MKQYYIQGYGFNNYKNRLIFDAHFQPVYYLQSSLFSTSQQIYSLDQGLLANLSHDAFSYKTTILTPPSDVDTLSKNYLLQANIFLQADFFLSKIALYKNGEQIGSIASQVGMRQVVVYDPTYEREILTIACATEFRRQQIIAVAICLSLLALFVIF